MRQIFKQLTEAIMNDITVKWKLGRKRRVNYPRYVYSEGIQIPSLLTSLGNKLLLNRFEF